ncbi:MFS transporter [Pseudolysinimonas kribbensis]|uniref:MFS transporter n=1 Tax=Pseudolysinimonas kribbensis TaxID=433641 RepID=A0ABQ6K4P3_9MICO|nr:MFS transporter [Pseudolysinimonas kribbensis]GMA95593.1 MFS transporter [Pseudolysinimonas kribbensis]
MTDIAAPVAVPERWRSNAAIFLSGQTVSLFGSMIVQYAVMWYVTLETKSGWAVALYALAAFAPQGLVSIFGGTLADRVNRRILAMTSDGVIALTTLALALVMMSGITDLWIILLAVGVRSIGAGVQQPAVQALIPQITPPDQLMRVNGLYGTVQSAMSLVAPAAAGLVFGLVGIVPTFFIDVVTAVIGIGLMALVRVPSLQRMTQATTGYFADLADGLRYIAGHGVVRWLLLVFTIIFVLTVAPSFLTPLMVARSFGDEPWMLAGLEVAFGIGMTLGGVAVSTVLAKRSRLGLILFSTFGFALLNVALGFSPNLWVFYGVMFVFGLIVPAFSAPFMTLIQETVEPEKHGRVFSYVGIVMALATPIGMVAFGPLADVWTVQVLLVLGGAATALVMLVAIVVPSGRSAIRAARGPAPERREATAEA